MGPEIKDLALVNLLIICLIVFGGVGFLMIIKKRFED
jgi:Trk-type K+ transport system membrane component